jgi:hypothetical protein
MFGWLQKRSAAENSARQIPAIKHTRNSRSVQDLTVSKSIRNLSSGYTPTQKVLGLDSDPTSESKVQKRGRMRLAQS